MASLKARRESLTNGHVTLATLFDKYDGSPAFRAKTTKTQAEDRRKLEQLLSFLGRDRDVTTIGPSMLNWATRERKSDGTPLLAHNPIRGIRLPVEKNPRRPIETYDRYLKLMRVASAVDWRLPLALALAESTGQRISAILHLRREDLALERLPYGWVQFRAEHQKNGCDHWVPLTKNTARLIRRQLRSLRSETTSWLFPADQQPAEPVDRWFMSRRLSAAYERAGLKALSGGLWHPFRRKFATERKHFPLRDVATAGG
ncbi:MAG TPA: tyrosine-type recombinase/integrase [Gemmatimonadales bacterium]|nr:tyrosine-type recombinase/integrase [Gemmatimonadales bacterium]